MFILMLLALAGVLFFGLRPKAYNFANNVSLTNDGLGLGFEKYSMAYTRAFEPQMVRQKENSTGLSVFLHLRPEPDFDDGFGLIVVMHNGNDAEQLIIGQWKSHIIAMNGDDYAHKRRLPRIAFDTVKYLGIDKSRVVESEIVKSRIDKSRVVESGIGGSRIDKSRVVESGIGGSRIAKSRIDKSESGLQMIVTSGRSGTRLYIDGKLIKEKANLMLKLPAGEGTRLILGNSPYGNASWHGEIYGLALYPGVFSEKEIDSMDSSRDGSAYPDQLGGAAALFAYDFKQHKGNRVKDLSGNSIDIQIPDRVVPLKKKILAWPRPGLEIDRRLFVDVGLNFLGFVPLGFLVAAVLLNAGTLSIRQRISLAVAVCFLVSLGIEVTQAWLPSRDSSMVDLVMNTMGAGGGAGTFIFTTRFARDTEDAEINFFKRIWRY
jgi:hypothetical protein